MYISVSMQQVTHEEYCWLANVLKMQYVRTGIFKKKKKGGSLELKALTAFNFRCC